MSYCAVYQLSVDGSRPLGSVLNANLNSNIMTILDEQTMPNCSSGTHLDTQEVLLLMSLSIIAFTLPPIGVQSIVVSMTVCLSVCLFVYVSARMSQKPHV